MNTAPSTNTSGIATYSIPQENKTVERSESEEGQMKGSEKSESIVNDPVEKADASKKQDDATELHKSPDQGSDNSQIDNSLTTKDVEDMGNKASEVESKKNDENPPSPGNDDDSRENEETLDPKNTSDDKENEHIDLTKPLKKARTPYFIFQQEKRPQVVKELGNAKNVTTVAKKIGELWSNLSNDEKEVYHAKARAEKEQYEKHYNALLNAGISPSSSKNDSKNKTSSKNNINDNDFVFPVSRIRKICRLDPDVKGMSKESTVLITKAAEYFLEKMASDTWSMTKMHQKRTIHAQDVLDICSLKEMFFFLREDIKDLIQEQKDDKKRKRDGKKSLVMDDNIDNGDDEQGKKKSKLNMSGVKPLTSYFTTSK